MKRIEEIWNASTKATVTKGIAICDLLECEVCGVREQCKNAKSHEEMDAGWVDSFEPVKDRKNVYKFNITEEMKKRVKAFVLPTLPKNWFTVRQPWQAL